MSELRELAEHVETAMAEQQRDMLCAAAEAICKATMPADAPVPDWLRRFADFLETDTPAFLDAAMTLVPEGWQVETLGQQHGGEWWCRLLRPLVADEEVGKVIRPSANTGSFDRPTPALALCAAALRAMEEDRG